VNQKVAIRIIYNTVNFTQTKNFWAIIPLSLVGSISRNVTDTIIHNLQ